MNDESWYTEDKLKATVKTKENKMSEEMFEAWQEGYDRGYTRGSGNERFEGESVNPYTQYNQRMEFWQEGYDSGLDDAQGEQ